MFFKKKVLIYWLTILILTAVFSSGLIAQARQIDRIVFVKAVADEEYIEFWGPEWKEVVKRMVEKASRAFEEEFGIVFEVVEFEEWQSEDYTYPKLSEEYNFFTHSYSNEANLILPWPFIEGLRRRLVVRIGRGFEFPLLFELKEEVKPKNADIIVAFTGQPELGPLTAKVDDIAVGRYVLIIDTPATLPWFVKKHAEALEILRAQKDLKKKEKNLGLLKFWFDVYRRVISNRLITERLKITRILIHELGHLFGAVHTKEDSIMKISSSTNRFDEKNKEIIFKYKWRKFK